MSEGKTGGRLAYEELSRRVGSEYDSWDKLPGDLRAAHEASVAAGAAAAHERTAELVSEVNELRGRLAAAEGFVKTWAPVLGFPCDQEDAPPAVVTSCTEHLAELIGGLAIPDEDGAA